MKPTTTTASARSWDEMYQKLRSYVEKHRSKGRSSCPLFSTDLTPVNVDAADSDLVAWIKEQRRQYRILRERGRGKNSSSSSSASATGELTLERIIDLERIGFTWEMKHDIEWRKRYEELRVYRNQYQTCLVPAKFDENKKLGLWVMTQRRQNALMMLGKPSRMTNERKRLLDDTGFVWILRERRHKVWKQRIEEMKKFKEEHGHFDVASANKPEYNELAEWLRKIRYHYQRLLKGHRVSCSMAEEAMAELDEIGFTWALLAPLKYRDINLPNVSTLLMDSSSNDQQAFSMTVENAGENTKASVSEFSSYSPPAELNMFAPGAIIPPVSTHVHQQHVVPNTSTSASRDVADMPPLQFLLPFPYHSPLISTSNSTAENDDSDQSAYSPELERSFKISRNTYSR